MSRTSPEESLREAYSDEGGRLRTLGRRLVRTIISRPNPSAHGLGTVLRLAMAVIVVSAGVVALLGVGSQPALAIGISASDITVTTSDGNLSAVTITPELDITWAGLDEPLHKMLLSIYVESPDSTHVTKLSPAGGGDYTGELSCDVDSHPDCGKASGSVTFDIARRNLLNGSHYYATDTPALNASDFFAADGDTNTTTVDIDVDADVYDGDGNLVISKSKAISFDVTVENTASNVSIAGDLNTSASD